MLFFKALADQEFLRHALLGGLLAGLTCGVVGPFVVAKRIGGLVGAVAHAVLGGMGIAAYLGRSPVVGAVIAALVAGWVVGWINLRRKASEDTMIGAVWAIGMAVGILFLAKTPGYNMDLTNYLFGNILWISRADLLWMAALNLVILGVVFLTYKPLVATVFDEEFAWLRGARVAFYHLLLVSLVAVAVVLLIRVVGLILVIALLTLPAAIARQHLASLPGMMLLASLLGAGFTSAGLGLSYGPDLPAGATITLVAGLAFLASTGWTSLRRRRGAR